MQCLMGKPHAKLGEGILCAWTRTDPQGGEQIAPGSLVIHLVWGSLLQRKSNEVYPSIFSS